MKTALNEKLTVHLELLAKCYKMKNQTLHIAVVFLDVCTKLKMFETILQELTILKILVINFVR